MNNFGAEPLEWYYSISHLKDDLTYADFERYRQSWIQGELDEQKLTEKELDYWKIDEITQKPIILGHFVTYMEIANTLHLIMVITPIFVLDNLQYHGA